jgi:hypothetical protein
MADAQLYNIFVCTELQFQLNKTHMKIEVSDYVWDREAVNYNTRQRDIRRRLRRQFDELNCSQYPGHLLHRLTELRKSALVVKRDETFDKLVLAHQSEFARQYDANHKKN